MKLYLNELMEKTYNLKLVNVSQLLKEVGLNKPKFREAVSLEAEKGLKRALIIHLDKDPLVALKLLQASFMAAASPLVDLELGQEAPKSPQKTFLFKKAYSATKADVKAEIQQIHAVLEVLVKIEPLLVSAKTAAKANDLIEEAQRPNEPEYPTSKSPQRPKEPNGLKNPTSQETNDVEDHYNNPFEANIRLSEIRSARPKTQKMNLEAGRHPSNIGKEVQENRLKNVKAESAKKSTSFDIMKKLRGIKIFER